VGATRVSRPSLLVEKPIRVTIAHARVDSECACDLMVFGERPPREASHACIDLVVLLGRETT